MDRPSSKRLGRERLQRIIETCKMIEERGLDPFSLNIEDFIETIKRFFPSLDNAESLILDSEAMEKIASVINLQSEWVKRRSTSLYTDPFLLKEKITSLGKEDFARLFLKVWRPIIELEQVTTRSLAASAKYWRDLLPLDIRWSKTGYVEKPLGLSTQEDLLRQRIISEETFTEELERYWEELKMRAEKSGKILYRDFIYSTSYLETLLKAYITSFLITYGYAKLEIQVWEEKIYLIPKEKPEPPPKDEEVLSYPISVDYEEWLRWKKGEREREEGYDTNRR